MLSKRPDGFHEIASLYQAISLGDFLTIIPNDGADRLICNDPTIPTDQSNLILRAANLFRQKTELERYFTFILDKRIPIEAGLGGGSSNAATTLWGLNEVMGTAVEIDELKTWAAELGSDVPFFLSSGRAYCEGRGERLTAETPTSSDQLWIVKPKIGLSTPAVYKNLNLSALQGRNPIDALHSHRTGAPLFFNDLEEAAFQLAPELMQIKQELTLLGLKEVHMTGSGTAFFCFGKEAPHHSHMTFYPAHFLYRSEQDWYKFPD